MILGGVGLGICTMCRAPGAFYYQPTIPGWPGLWVCDSCQLPIVAALRIRADIIAQRARITTPTASRHGNQCATAKCELDAGHPDHHEDRHGASWRTYEPSPNERHYVSAVHHHAEPLPNGSVTIECTCGTRSVGDIEYTARRVHEVHRAWVFSPHPPPVDTYTGNPTCPHGLNGNVYCGRCDRCLCEACRAIT